MGASYGEEWNWSPWGCDQGMEDTGKDEDDPLFSHAMEAGHLGND